MPLYAPEDALPPLGATPQGYPAGYEATPDPTRPEFETVGEQPLGEAQPSVVRRRKEKVAPTLGETTSAAFSLENEVSGAWRRINDENQYGPYDPDHNPYDTIKGTELEPFAFSFLGSANQKHTDVIASRIREELKSRKILENAGWTGTAMSVVASLASPTTLLPGGAFYRSARAGQAALRSAGSVGAWAAGGAALQEGALQSQQYTRSLLESGIAIGGSAILGGILGAGVSGLSSRRFIAMSRALDDELRVGQQIAETLAERESRGVGASRLDEVAIGGSARASDAGAASVRMPDLESKGAMGVDSVTEWATPNRVFSSPSPVAREVFAQIVESPRMFTRNEEGFTTAPRGGSIETRIKTQGVAKLGTAAEIVREQWMKYRFGQPVAVPGMRHVLDRGSGRMSEREFRHEISKAWSRGDQHDIPEVAAAAREIRKRVVDPIADAAIKQKLLDADVVAKGRPRSGGSGGTPQGGGPAPGGAGGGLAADPVARAGAEDVLRQFEAVSGMKLDDVSRKAAVDVLLSDNDVMRQIRSLLGLDGDVPFPALADQASRQARAELNAIVERLDRGEAVTMPPEHVAAHYAKLGPALDASSVDASKVGVISEIRPVGGGLVSISVATRSGKVVKLPHHFVQFQIEGARAFYDSASGFTVFSRLYGVGSVSEKSLIGELRHENVHRLWRSLGVDVRDRLVAHAEKLRVLDYDSRSYFDVVDVPGASHMDTTTLGDAYSARFIDASAEYKPLTKYVLDKNKSIKDAKKLLEQMRGQPDPEIIKVMTEELAEMRADLASARARVAAIESDVSAKIGEEAVAHMVEMHYHGLIGDADIAPVRAELDRLFGGMRTAEQDAIDRVSQELEVMLAMSDRNIGQSMRRELDTLGYYSKALEAARSLKQAKGTPEQMLAQLKAAGVKDAEIEATKLRGAFEGKHSVTRDEIVKHLEEKRVGLNEVVRAPASHLNDLIQRMQAEGADDAEIGIMIGEMGGRGGNYAKWSSNSLDPSNPTYKETVLHLPGKTVDEISERQAEIEARRAEITSALANLRANEAAERGLVRRLSPGHARRVEELTREQERLAREGEALQAEVARQGEDIRAYQGAFVTGHFPEPNIVGHMQSGLQGIARSDLERLAKIPGWDKIVKKALDGDKDAIAYVLHQIQSDWGQKLRDGGVRDEAKIAELKAQIKEISAKHNPALDAWKGFAMRLREGRDPVDWLPTMSDGDLSSGMRKAENWFASNRITLSPDERAEFQRLFLGLEYGRREVYMASAELRTAEASAPGHPLVNTTDQWTNTILRRAIRQAVEAKVDFIAIPFGRKTVMKYNSGDAHGMDHFYGGDGIEGIVPKNLRKLLRGIDKDTPAPQIIRTLNSPSGKTGLGDGFTLFPLTDKVKRSVMEDGQPMFALGGSKRPASEIKETLPRQITELIDPYLAASRAAEAAGLGVERDATGNIVSVMRDGKRYTINRDAEGNVTGITEAPDQGTRSFAVQRAEDGSAQGLDDPAMVALQEQATAVRENLTKTLTQAASRMGIKGVKPEMVNALSERIMEAAQKALYEGASPEAAVARTIQEALDPAGAIQSRIMAAIGGGRSTHPQMRGISERGEPPLADGMVRLYHGGDPPDDPSMSLWVSSDFNYAQGYATKNGRNAGIWYVDAPESHPLFKPDYDDQGFRQGFTITAQLPPELAQNRKLLTFGEAKPSIKTLSDAEQWRARQIMREIEHHLADIKAAEGGGGGDEFSKTVGDRIWDDGGQSYRHRVWDRVRVKAGRPRLVEIITEHFEGGQRRAQAELKTMLDDLAATGKAPSGQVAKEIENLQQFVNLSRQELKSNAELTVDHILGAAEGRMVADLPNGVRGALKARTLRIPDALIEDFLEKDAMVIMRHYINSMVADTEIKRMFGSLTLEEQIAKINEDFHRLFAAAPDEKTRIALQNRRDSDVRDIVAMVDRVRGTYKLPDDPMSWGPRVVRGLKDINYVTKLGGMVISAISDPFRVMMTHGVLSYFGDGVVPLLRGLKGMKLAGEELRLAGAAWDMMLNTRGTQLADVMDDYGRYSKFERGLGWMSDKFSTITGMNQWNVALKTFSGTIVMNNIIRDSIAVMQGVASKKQIDRLHRANIDLADARTIAEQFGKHGEVVNGVYLANSKAWDDTVNVQNVVEVFRGAIVQDVDRIIVTPGIADKPLWASENVRSLVFQFKSFGFASMERTLIAGLQQRDAGVLMGAMLMIGMGAVAEYLKATVNRKELPKNNAMWVAAAVDRSGLLGWLPEINHAMEQLTGGQVGVAALTGKELSRYASRNWADSALGPTAGMMKDLYGATSGISRAIAGKERLRESDLAALRRMIPLNNIFYLSYLFQSLESSAAQALGAQPSTRRITPGR